MNEKEQLTAGLSSGEAWKMYLGNTMPVDDFSHNPDAVRKRLLDPASKVFSRKDFEMQITDLSPGHVNSQTYKVPAAAESALCSEPADLRMRIISIFCKRTITPLQITPESMLFLLWKYQVHPDFLSVLFQFDQDPWMSEGCSDNYSCHKVPDSDETKISYQIRYVEAKYSGEDARWSFRRTGVYHHHTATKDVFILLHPTTDPIVETRLQKLIDKGVLNVGKSQASGTNAFQIHSLLMSSYLDNWTWYLRYQDEKFSNINDVALGQDAKKLNATNTFDRVQSLRNISDQIIFARACCSSNLQILDSLSQDANPDPRSLQDMKSRSNRLRGNIESADVLKSRARNCIDLVGYTLSHHNSLAAAAVNDRLLHLSVQTVDDSSTVKLITVFSAFFLPGSFVATIYGMNFFRFDQDTHSITIANDFWIFLATWLPLTAVVCVLYFLFLRLQEKKKGRPFRPQHWPFHSTWQVLVNPGEDPGKS